MPIVPFTAIDHVQLAIPRGGEDTARKFYIGILAMIEIPKPQELAGRGGLWLSSGTVQIHLGVEDDFRPARKAHPALCCADYSALTRRLKEAGVELKADVALPGIDRCHITDPFGNRIELVSALP
ncbi:MAG TPA: hypothetical protein VLW84_00380 [Terriglobales bacterium]|nr:hypothetical protein [Terriglobales bacterium]